MDTFDKILDKVPTGHSAGHSLLPLKHGERKRRIQKRRARSASADIRPQLKRRRAKKAQGDQNAKMDEENLVMPKWNLACVSVMDSA